MSVIKKTLKDPQRHSSRWRAQVLDYLIEVTRYRAEDLLFLDETGSAMNLILERGRAPKGQRVTDFNKARASTRISAIGALSTQGIVAALCFEGALHGGVFSYFIQHFPSPHLKPGKVLVLDNARALY